MRLTQFKPRYVTVTRDRQRELLNACGIGQETFGRCVDPASFVATAALEAGSNGFDLSGVVNKGLTLSLTRQVWLDEPLFLVGTLSETESDDGVIATSRVTLSNANGDPCIAATSVIFRPLVRTGRPPSARRSATPGAGKDADRLRPVGRARFTPQGVLAYSGSSANPIHIDPKAASDAGFRAPIIGGAQGVSHLTAAIWNAHRVDTLEFEVRFRRPIFWDDECTIAVREVGGAWRSVCLVREDRIATELVILGFTRTEAKDMK
jgi:hypothetical protein